MDAESPSTKGICRNNVLRLSNPRAWHCTRAFSTTAAFARGNVIVVGLDLELVLDGSSLLDPGFVLVCHKQGFGINNGMVTGNHMTHVISHEIHWSDLLTFSETYSDTC